MYASPSTTTIQIGSGLAGVATCTSRWVAKRSSASGASEAVIAERYRSPRAGLQRLADDRALGRPGLVQAPDRRLVRRVARDLRILLALDEDRGDRVGERVERLHRLGLGRLDQQGLVDDQREVD